MPIDGIGEQASVPNDDRALAWKGSAGETPTPPACVECRGSLSLAAAIDSFGDRPPVHVYKCENCSRLVMFFLEDGQLRKW
jgi:hypothetical protein